jgi:hypothetical protein
VTDLDWDTAARWKSYAEPEDPARKCHPNMYVDHVIQNILRVHIKLLSAAPLNRAAVKKYVSLHAYHTTRIEGDTLTLPETILVVDKELLAGFPNDLLSPTSGVSVLQVRNIQQVVYALGLGDVPSMSPARLPSIQSLVDVQAAVTRDLKVPFAIRLESVTSGSFCQCQMTSMPSCSSTSTGWLLNFPAFLRRICLGKSAFAAYTGCHVMPKHD